MNSRPRILLVDYANYESHAEIPAVFANADCEVDIFCDDRSWLKRNKYWQQWIPCDKNEDLFFKHLKEIAESDVYDWIVLGDDPAIRVVNDRVNDEKIFYKLLPIKNIENRAILGSKAGLSAICEKYDLKTPGYLLYDTIENEHEIVERLGFPVMLKKDRSDGGSGTYYCHNETMLYENLNSMPDKKGLVIQEFIKGELIGIEVLYKDGELLAYNYGDMVKTLYSELGVSTERLFYTNSDIEAELIKAGRSIGINGFGNLTFIYDTEEKVHYLIEADLRPQAWIYYGKFCGVDFSEAVKKYLKNDLSLIIPGKKNKEEGKVVAHYTRDMMRCILDKDIKGFFKWILNINGRWKYIPFYDRKLLYYTHIVIYQFLKNDIKHGVRVLKGNGIRHSSRKVFSAIKG